jgi:uncharacterized protein YoxC
LKKPTVGARLLLTPVASASRAASWGAQAVPILVQVCIVIATLTFVVATVALVRLLVQARATAAQLERTMAHVDAVLPTFEQTVEELRSVLDTTSVILARVDRVSSDVEGVSGKARQVSELVVNRFLMPVGDIAALVQGVRTGASFLFGAHKKRRAAETARASEGGNHHE